MTTASETSMPFKFSTLLLAIRPKTLPASISPVILGSVMALPHAFNVVLFLFSCGVALFLQIGVNLANDFFDAKSGVDTRDRLGPTRVTQSGLMTPRFVVAGIALCIALAMACGMVLIMHSGWPLLAIGLLCIATMLAYSGGPYPLASHGLGEIAVLIFFGWVAVMGSYYIQTGLFSWQVFLLANALGVVLAAIMLVNNLRDIRTDKAAGKITLAVLLGDSGSRLLYKTLIMLAIFLHCFAFLFFPAVSKYLVTFAPLVVCAPLGYRCMHKAKTSYGRNLNTLLAETALLGLSYATTTAIAFWVEHLVN